MIKSDHSHNWMTEKEVKQTIYNIIHSRIPGINQQKTFPSKEIIFKIIKSAKKVFKSENSLLRLNGNFVIVGDIHGNIDDLIRIFEKSGYPPEKKYLFLGDYIDRGENSSEVILLLLSLKILYPDSIFLIRGNHECESISTMYGFKNECLRNFDSEIYNKFMKCFMYLSFAAVVNDSYFCVHGGIGPSFESLDEIENLPKPLLSSNSKIASDLVWSDPSESVDGFTISPRGSGHLFNNEKLNHFLNQNELKKLIRSHETCMDGIDYPLENCITVFSNSDYCEMNNDAAIIIIKQDLDSELSSPSEDSDELFSISAGYSKDDSSDDIQIETFCPLSAFELKKRRILIPDWIFLGTEKEIIQSSICFISANDLFDHISEQPICVY